MPRPPRPRAIPRAAATAVIALLVFSFALADVPSASAHATIVSTAPANGSEVDARPDAVTVVFDEPVTLPGTDEQTSVVDEDGDRVDVGEALLDAGRTTLTIPLDGDLREGIYIASWSVVSADTHPVGGSIQFGYGRPASAASTSTAREPAAGLTLLVALVKALVYLGLVLALGVLPAALLLGAGDAERRLALRLARYGTLLTAVASIAQAAVQYLWTASASPPVDADGLAAAITVFAGGSYAVAVVIRLLALAAIAVLLPRERAPRGPRTVALVVLAVAAVVTVVVNGHGGSGGSVRFFATTVHALAAVAWIGGLVVLGWLILRRRLDEQRLGRMPRWSLYAGGATALLALSGVLQAVSGVGFLRALVETEYGLILLAKIALVIVALALGLSGFLWVRRELRRSGPDGLRPAPGRTAVLRRRVRWEAGIAVVIVVLSGALSSITPGAAAWSPSHTASERIGRYDVTIEVVPVRTGPEVFRVTVVQPSEDSALPQRLEVLLSADDGTVSNLEVDFPYRVPGTVRAGEPTPVTFTSSATTVPSAGGWTATVTVVVDDLHQYTDAFAFDVS